MSKNILVCGHGPGISNAVARRFGAEGFGVGLVARNAERLSAAAEALSASGVRAVALPCDLSDASDITALVARAREALGPITAIHWNAYGGGAGDLTTGSLELLRRTVDMSVSSLVAAVQAALPDLLAQAGSSALLVTNGGFGLDSPQADGMAVQFGAMDLAVSNAARHKLAGLFHTQLGPRGVYVGEVIVMGMVKGTAWDQGQATLDPADIAQRFWEIYSARSDRSVMFG